MPTQSEKLVREITESLEKDFKDYNKELGANIAEIILKAAKEVDPDNEFNSAHADLFDEYGWESLDLVNTADYIKKEKGNDFWIDSSKPQEDGNPSLYGIAKSVYKNVMFERDRATKPDPKSILEPGSFKRALVAESLEHLSANKKKYDPKIAIEAIETVYDTLLRYTKADPASIDTRLAGQMGVDSIHIVQMSMDLEEELDIEIDDSRWIEKDNDQTMRGMVSVLYDVLKERNN